MRALTTRLHPVTAVIGAILTLVVLAWIMLVGLAQNAAAQGQRCLPRADMIGHLTETYGENRRAIGMTASGAVIELWGNEDTGTWSVTQTRPTGITCFVAAGDGFEMRDDIKPASGEPT